MLHLLGHNNQDEGESHQRKCQTGQAGLPPRSENHSKEFAFILRMGTHVGMPDLANRVIANETSISDNQFFSKSIFYAIFGIYLYSKSI